MYNCDEYGGVMMVTYGDTGGVQFTCQKCGKAIWMGEDDIPTADNERAFIDAVHKVRAAITALQDIAEGRYKKKICRLSTMIDDLLAAMNCDGVC